MSYSNPHDTIVDQMTTNVRVTVAAAMGYNNKHTEFEVQNRSFKFANKVQFTNWVQINWTKQHTQV